MLFSQEIDFWGTLFATLRGVDGLPLFLVLQKGTRAGLPFPASGDRSNSPRANTGPYACQTGITRGFGSPSGAGSRPSNRPAELIWRKRRISRPTDLAPCSKMWLETDRARYFPKVDFFHKMLSTDFTSPAVSIVDSG